MREFNRIETEPKLTEIELNLGVLRAATQTITGRNKVETELTEPS